MLRLFRLSLVTLSCVALLAAKVIADELEDVVGEVTLPAAETPVSPKSSQAVAVELTFTNFKMEAMLVALAIGLVANYFYGSRTNTQLSKTWEKPIAEVLNANFSLVGDGKRVLEWDSAADMLLYASGRRHCKFVQGHLMLKARQDPVSLLNDLVANNQEKLEMEIVLNEDEFVGFVFAAVQRKRAKALNRDRYDISTFTKIVANDKISPKLVLFSENADATAQLLESGLGDILADNNSLLEELVITDSPAEKPDSHEFKRDKKLSVVIRLPEATNNNIAQFKELLEFVFYLVDYIPEGINLRPESVRKLAKTRDEAFKEFSRMVEQDKQEALAKALSEKRRIELEQVGKMSPEQRRKWEEKDRKKQLKKEQSKRVRRVK
ncbi:hypothetical protein LPJ66_005117 [Kickxella alabastrina]|uniref:Uncharacterized protein n=1 Tax=Kickxella alabastrina TaxID=61397 RepID=A0ACC1IFN4_9FUNG|nr:hypothetical protein LPJ66_005117 [Kickxella alabastrina]